MAASLGSDKVTRAPDRASMLSSLTYFSLVVMLHVFLLVDPFGSGSNRAL